MKFFFILHNFVYLVKLFTRRTLKKLLLTINKRFEENIPHKEGTIDL